MCQADHPHPVSYRGGSGWRHRNDSLGSLISWSHSQILICLETEVRPISGRTFGTESSGPWDMCHGVDFLTKPFALRPRLLRDTVRRPRAARPDFLSTLLLHSPHIGGPSPLPPPQGGRHLLSIPNSSRSLLTEPRAADTEDWVAVNGALLQG